MKIKNTLNRIASILALAIGLMAVFAGGKVLIGVLPDYYVIDWLPIYNFTMGVVSAFFSSIVIWKNGKFAMPAAIGTLGFHAVVMLILQTAYHEVVAPDSIVAMNVRLTVWAIITGLLIAQQQIKKESLMKIIKTFEVTESPNPHFISARVLHVGEAAQFEHLILEPGQEQKKHVAYTTVHLYVLEGTGVLEAGDETIPLSADMFVEMPPETHHRLVNSGAERLRVLNVKAPRPTKSTHIVAEKKEN